MTGVRHLACLSVLLVLACHHGPPTIENSDYAPALKIDIGKFTKTADGLYYRDLVKGGGAVVTAGQTVAVRYTGPLPDGIGFDSVPPGGAPAIFPVGVGRLIKGWDEGLVGATVGSTRQLIVPPILGYGPAGSGQVPPNAIMVFTVEILGAQ